MTNIYMLLLMSVSGTIMYMLSIIFGKRSKHYVWQYAMLVTSVIMLLVPIQKLVEIPRFFKVTVPKTLDISDIVTAPAALQSSVSAADIITTVWLIGMVIFAARMIYKYIRTSLMLRQITEECYTEKILDSYFNVSRKLSVRRNIILRSSKYLNSPLLFGIFKPTIIIPDKAFSQRELEMILTHELTHYKHRDLWIAFAASIAGCVHWFNPAVYFIAKSITEVCELFCDETVVKHLNGSDKKAYGNLILSVIEKELNSRLAYTTSMASAKNSIQKRLRKIVEFKMPTKASTIAGIMAVFACVVSSLTAFGFETAAEVIPEEIKQIMPIAIPTPNVTPEAIPMPTVEPEADTPKAMPNAFAETEDYTEDSDKSYTDENADIMPIEPYTDENADIIPAESYTVEKVDIIPVDDPITSYVFNADFSENTDVQSETFRAKNGTKLSISKVTGDAYVSVHNAETGEVIYDEREDKMHDSLSMTLPESGEYYVTAYSEDGESAGIYIYGE